MAFGAFKDFEKRLNKLNPDKMFVDIIRDPAITDKIIHLNTQEQLYERGIDSKGNSLGDYSARTIAYKTKKGQRYDHVTLQDTGEFYRSFRVITGTDGFMITADARKPGMDQNLDTVYGEAIIGLTNASIQEIKPDIQEKFIEETRRVLFKG